MPYKISACFFAIILLGAFSFRSGERVETLPYYNSADFTPHWIASRGEALGSISHTIGAFALTDQDGKTVTRKSVKGKIHVANFFFTGCSGICPLMCANFETLQKTFAVDSSVVLLSFSVAPWNDSVAVLKAYAKEHGAIAGKWHLLTGSASEIYALARNSYFAEEEPGVGKDSTQFLHTEHFILVDRDERIRGIYNGTLPLEAQRLTADIRQLENENNW
jgi:protein SCO1/2